MTLVRVDGLSKHFPVRRTWQEIVRAPFRRTLSTAVDDVSFTVQAGEVFGLLGQNGAGKTTLFRLLCTLVLPDAGTAEIDGLDVQRHGAAVRRRLAPVLANERTLNWRLSARENLRLYAALQGLHGARARDEIARVLRVTTLADAGEKLVGAFSSGMRQRLLIARALLGRPQLLLLDEPTRSLDPISAREFRRFLRETVVDGEGCTVLLATHDADEVWDLCDRVGVLERGRLLAVAPTPVMRHLAGSDRFRVWLRASDRAAATAAAHAGGLTLVDRGAAIEPGWVQFDCEVEGGSEGAARALALLGADGRAIARFDRAAPSLADLIQRVLARDADGARA